MRSLFSRIKGGEARSDGSSAPAGRSNAGRGRATTTSAAVEFTQELLKGLEHFVLSTPDLDAAQCLERIRGVRTSLESPDDLSELEAHRTWAARGLSEYGQMQRRYISERESELWRLLQLYQEHQRADGLVNQQFHEAIRGFHDRIGNVSRLDDIRAVRERMESELKRADVLLEAKTRADRQRSASLMAHVRELESDLMRARDESSRDPLTGLLNRRAIEAQIGAILQMPHSSAFAMIDVDDLKAVNDSYGHLPGDRALQLIVKRIIDCTRPGDLLGRYGGDEFVFVAPNQRAAELGDRLEEICRPQQEILDWEDRYETLVLSVSIGVVASLPDDTPATVLERADHAMYAAKAAGKARLRIG